MCPRAHTHHLTTANQNLTPSQHYTLIVRITKVPASGIKLTTKYNDFSLSKTEKTKRSDNAYDRSGNSTEMAKR